MRAVLFNRNADHFSEQRLNDETGVGVMRRCRRKRTTLDGGISYHVWNMKK